MLGKFEGFTDGIDVGVSLGYIDMDGYSVDNKDGCIVGPAVGLVLGLIDGLNDGLIDIIDGNGASVHDPISCVSKNPIFALLLASTTPSIITV